MPDMPRMVALRMVALRMVALLRGVNVGGNRRVPMAELRKLAEKLGWSDVETYIQSGNLVFSCDLTPLEAEQQLERALAKKFGFSVEVVVRTTAAWARYMKKNPFSDAAKNRPRLLHLALCKATPKAGAVTLLRQRATGERIEVDHDALWIDFVDGVGRSKLTPALLDRAVGSTVTARNYQTVLELAERLRRRES
jgi:uncharacterized protein (DUF1697 family)